MKYFFPALTGMNRRTLVESDLTAHSDDASALTAQVPTTPANHATFLATAEQQAIADANSPIHDADSLSTGTRQLEYLKRLASWGQVKVSEARIRANEDCLNQLSMIGALKATLRQQQEAEKRTARAKAEADEARAACIASIGSSATARVEKKSYILRHFGLLSAVVVAFGGEILFNYMGLSFLGLGVVETYIIAGALAIILFAAARQVACSFQDRHPAKWLALGSFLVVLVCVSVMLTALRDAAITQAASDLSGLGPSDAGAATTGKFLKVATTAGLTTMQIAFPLTIAFIELLDTPEAKVYHQALRKVETLTTKENRLKQKYPDLPERIEAADIRSKAVDERIQNEIELIGHAVADAQNVYITTFIHTVGSPEVTTAMDIRLDAIEQQVSPDQEG